MLGMTSSCKFVICSASLTLCSIILESLLAGGSYETVASGRSHPSDTYGRRAPSPFDDPRSREVRTRRTSPFDDPRSREVRTRRMSPFDDPRSREVRTRRMSPAHFDRDDVPPLKRYRGGPARSRGGRPTSRGGPPTSRFPRRRGPRDPPSRRF